MLNVVNRHRDQAVETDIEFEDKQVSGTVEVSEINAPDIKAENNFNSTTVKTVSKSASAGGTTLKYTFPPHSFTMLKGSVS